jgi:hypothetical protein
VTVDACNESAKCGPPSNPASGPGTDPYGLPYPPSVTATQSGDTIIYAWSGGGNNGRPVANYTVCIDGTCSSKGASAGSTAISYGCSTSHSISASVTDTVGQTNSYSVKATASTQTCNPPNPPTLSVTASYATSAGYFLTWGLSGGGGNTLPFTYNFCPPNAGCEQGAPTSITTGPYQSCGTQLAASASVTDTIGQNSPLVSATATTKVCPTASISKGGAETTSYCTAVAECFGVSVTLSNFLPNTTYLVWFSTNCATTSSELMAKCETSAPGYASGMTNYLSVSITTDAYGNYSNSALTAFGYPGASLVINVGAQNPGGVQSNTISSW